MKHSHSKRSQPGSGRFHKGPSDWRGRKERDDKRGDRRRDKRGSDRPEGRSEERATEYGKKTEFKKSAFRKKFHGKKNEWPDFKKPNDGERGDDRREGPREERKFEYGKKPDFKKKFRDRKGPRPDFKRGGRPERTDEAPRGFEKTRGDAVLIWGLHAAKAAWLNPERRCHRLWLTEAGQKTFDDLIVEAKDQLLKRPDPKKSERHDLERLLPPNSVHQGVVLEASPLPELSLHDVISGDTPPDLLLMLDQITDPHNVGAILRSAAALGAGAVIMTERNAPGTTGVLAKAASGAVEHVPQIHVVNLARALDELQEAGYWRVGLAEEGAKDLSRLDLSGRTVLVMGAEGDGLRQLTRKKCDELARLPTAGPISSLNVSNAAAIALYEVRRQKKPLA